MPTAPLRLLLRRRCHHYLYLVLLFSFSGRFGMASGRRILHQPFFPQDSFPPSHSPIPLPPPPPVYPFSTSTPDVPFFPSLPSSPPPPSPVSFTSLPADISSLSVPHHASSKSAPTRLIVAAVAAVFAAVAIVSLAVFLHLRRRNRSSSSDSKTQRSDNDSAIVTTRCNASHIPKLNRPSQTSSEFLYLGTLVDSHGGSIESRNVTYIGNGSTMHDSGASTSRKMDSPELRPLPPLNRYRKIYSNAAAAAPSREDEDDEYYSPKSSPHDRDNSFGNGSASRRGFASIEVNNFNGLISSSSTHSAASGSISGSPVRSVSVTLSPANSSSPGPGIPKSPDLIAIQAPSSFHVPTRSPKESASPSPPSSSSSDRVSKRTQESSPRISDVSDQIAGSESPARIPTGLVQADKIVIPSFPPSPHRVPAPPPTPPPPPPPLPSKTFETPRSQTHGVKIHSVAPPDLVTPFRPAADKSSPLIAPIFSVDSKTTVKNEDNEFSTTEKNDHLTQVEDQNEEITPKPKLKPLHWDKVRASSDREMVWDQLKSSSFKLNEAMIETLFIVNTPNPNSKETTRWQAPPKPGPDNGNLILDPKKAQNVSILLRAHNVTVEEVCEGLLEGNSDVLGAELLENLLKMAPTKEEERKLKEYNSDSPLKLGTAEKFLKAVLDIPHAFRRVDAMLYVSNFESEVDYLKRSFETLEAACEELRTSRMFLKLLEAVLKTGNRMNVGTNRGDAHAFKLDTLLKLVDVKGADGKTTLLHFVVQEIIKSEGVRHSSMNLNDKSSLNDDAKCRKIGLQVVSGLSSELSNVKKAAAMDAEMLSCEVFKLSNGIMKIAEVVRLNEGTASEEGSLKFSESMNSFMKKTEEDIIKIQALESVALSLVKEITEYFHGNSLKEEAHPFRIFLIVRDFLTILDRVCKEVGMINERTIVSSEHKFPVPVNPMLQSVAMGFLDKQKLTSSDEESSSP